MVPFSCINVCINVTTVISEGYPHEKASKFQIDYIKNAKSEKFS